MNKEDTKDNDSSAGSIEGNGITEGEMKQRLKKEQEIIEIAEKAWVIRQKNRELEWFEMESKVRALVYELVKPTAIKCDANKSESIEIIKDSKELEKRIKHLEYWLKVTKKKEAKTVFDDINDKIFENEQKRINSVDILESQIKSLEKNTKNISDDWISLRGILSRIENKFDEMYKELNSLASIQVKDKDEIHDKFTVTSSSMFAQIEKVTKRCEFCENQSQGLKLSSDLLATKFEENSAYMLKLEKHLNQYKHEISRLDDEKANKESFESKYEMVEEGIETLDRSMSVYDNRIKYLENFIDKYIPIQVQSMISDSISKVIVNDSQNKKFKKYLQEVMLFYHDRILNDEGVGDLEISMDILAGKAANLSRKKNMKALFQKKIINSMESYDNKLSISSNKSNRNMDTISSAPIQDELEHDVILEKSEVDSPSNSSAKASESSQVKHTITINESDAQDTQKPKGSQKNIPMRKNNSAIFGKAFVQKDGQYHIEELKKPDSLFKQSAASHTETNFINDMQEVEEVLFNVQNNYVHMETKVRDQIRSYTEDIQNKMNDMTQNIESSNNQMNVYMQMLHQDIEQLKNKA